MKEQNNASETYRPPQSCLNFFWTLAEGTDQNRVEAAIELVKMIQSIEQKSDREQITTYCINRLVRGLGSGRKFARVGFSTALTLMLRLQSELKTNQVLLCFKESFNGNSNASTKSEKAALYLGHAFALSTLVQSGRISKVKGEVLGSIVEDLLLLYNKRSFLKPVCCKALEDLIAEVSEDSFRKQVWPKLTEKLSLGWDGCTLDRVSLLLVCKDKFPDIVNKKFYKKHWGQTIFSEDNDAKLLQAVQISTEKSSALRERILPSMLKEGRDALSIWTGLGEKMFTSGKDNIISQQQLISLQILQELIYLSKDSQQVLSLILDPSVTKAIFMENYAENQALGTTLNKLISSVCEKLGGDLLSFVKKVLEMEGETEENAGSGKLKYIHSNNFIKIISQMDRTETEKYVDVLIEFVKGKDGNRFFSESGKKREKQLDWCFRQLQHVCCSQSHTTSEMQHSVLTLFLRNGFFTADKKNDKVLHCDFVDRLVETGDVKKLCELFLLKSLGQLSTMNTSQDKKVKSFSTYVDLLSHLVHYFQSLLSCADVNLVSDWSEETQDLWKQLLKRITSLEKTTTASSSSDVGSAFRLLYLYMAFHMLTDLKAASELLQDIFICHDKSKEKVKKKKKAKEDVEEPHWGEVLTEILLQLLSCQSHLARVISSQVFKLMVPFITTEAVTLLSQVLIPNKSQQSLMFEENDEEEEEEGDEEENGDLLDEDVASEESEDEDADDEEEEEKEGDAESEEEDEDKMEVDEQLRASVKEVLGKAAVQEDESDDDISDLSDSEMFKMDEALAEVFRQRKRLKGGKKAKTEKRKELANFRLRVLDLVDVLIKSDRCGDFILDLLKPMLVLMFSSSQAEEQAACDRAKSSFQLLKKKCRGVKDSIHTEEEQISMFQELIELAQRVNNSSQLQHIASACYVMIKISSADCLQLLQDTLNNVINKRQTKPLPSFFIALRETDPIVFQPLCAILIDSLKSESVKLQSKSLACSLLASLAKKTKAAEESSVETDHSWMMEAAKVSNEHVMTLEKETVRGLFVKELLTLTLSLLGRRDVLSCNHFGSEIKQKLLGVKSKMGMDSRRITNKIISALDRMSKVNGKVGGKKRKAEKMDSPKPKKKKQKKNTVDI